MRFKRSAGILLNPTSLPSPYGIGDFGSSAYAFVDYLESAGMKLWQLLPLGHTSFGDSPYQSFSAFAGNPLLISPEILCSSGFLTGDDITPPSGLSPDSVDYGTTLKYKTGLYQKAFSSYLKNADSGVRAAFKKFCSNNSFWLNDYALFIALKDYFIEKRKNELSSPEYQAFSKLAGKNLEENVKKDYYYGGVWVTWPQDILMRKTKAIEKYSGMLSTEIEYYKFLQFLFYQQWGDLKAYANERGIKIIGDIPIFVAYDSADVWGEPKNFYIDSNGFPTLVAGVPPDYFSETGQLWGNPLYNWDEHKKTGYKWWIARIAATLSTVDILRIDHFRGFEAYWAVPFGDKTAENGKWRKGPNNSLFDAIKKALGELPIIAEDLGVITPEVEALRDGCGFPGMKVLQFAFDNSKANAYLPHMYSQNCVVYTGTHDNDTTEGWYAATNEGERDKFRRYMNVSGETPARDLIRLALSSTADLAIFPLQDVFSLGSGARMNTPSTPSGNWKWRYRPEALNPSDAKALKYLAELFNRC